MVSLRTQGYTSTVKVMPENKLVLGCFVYIKKEVTAPPMRFFSINEIILDYWTAKTIPGVTVYS